MDYVILVIVKTVFVLIQLFDIGNVFRTKIFTKKKNFFSSFNNDRNLSLDYKTKDYVDRISGGQVNSLKEVTQLRCIYQVLKFPNKLLNIIVKVEFTPF